MTMSGDVLTMVTEGRGVDWHQMGGGQGWCRAQDSPTTQSHPVQNVSSAGVEKPCFKSL